MIQQKYSWIDIEQFIHVTSENVYSREMDSLGHV